MMSKNYKSILILFIAVLFAFASCKKDNAANGPTINLTADTGKTVNVSIGETISVTVANPGDGGFIFDAWQYDASVLHLNSHQHIVTNTNPEITGDFGEDNWKFTTLKSGATLLKITASRSTVDTVTMFSDTIMAK